MPKALTLRWVVRTSSIVTGFGGGRVDEALGVIDQFAGEFAGGVAGDGAALRHRCVLKNVPAAQRRGIEDIIVAAAHQHDRMGGRDRIEFACQRQALLPQLGFVPVGIADDHVARFGGGGRRADRRQQVRDRARCRQIDAGAAAFIVEMPVRQARHHEAAGQIDHLGGGAHMRAHLRRTADRDEAIAGNREALRQPCAVPRRENLAVDGDEIGRLGERRARQPAQTIPSRNRHCQRCMKVLQGSGREADASFAAPPLCDRMGQFPNANDPRHRQDGGGRKHDGWKVVKLADVTQRRRGGSPVTATAGSGQSQR